MIRYKSSKQLSIEEFRTPFEIRLDKNNRWVKLSRILPWDELADVYYSKLSSSMGAPSIDARIVIGAMIVKHKLKLDDREAIEHIRENPYVQYFLGKSDYSYEDIFDRSLFTALRYRMGEQEFDQLNSILIEKAEDIENTGKVGGNKKGKASAISSQQQQSQESEPKQSPLEPNQAEQHKNKGKLILDATVADQMIVYPTDLGLLNTSREESERIIDALHTITGEKKKPRTYRKRARKQYLSIAKKKSKTKKEIRKGIGQQLNYLKRNINSIHKQLDKIEKQGGIGWRLSKRDQKIFWVIQQTYMKFFNYT